MQSTHRMYPTIKCFTLYSIIRQTTVLRADLLHFPGPKKLPKLVHQCGGLLKGMACKISHRLITAVKISHIIQSNFYFVLTGVIDQV